MAAHLVLRPVRPTQHQGPPPCANHPAGTGRLAEPGVDTSSRSGGALGRLEEHHLDGMKASPKRDLALTRTPIVVRDGLAPDAELGAIVGREIEGVERVVRYPQQP